MPSRLNVRMFIPWVAILVAPLIVNGIIWRGFVIPQRSQLSAWHDAETLIELRPKLDEVLSQSRQIRIEWADTAALTRKDYAEVMQAVQKSAGRFGVQVKETRMKGQETQKEAAGQTTLPLELEVTGSFSKLARWISDVESQDGFQIDSWTLKPGSAQSPQLQLSVRMTVFLGGA